MGEFEPEIKRMTAKRKAEIVKAIFQGKTTVAEVSRQYGLTPALIKEWMEDAKKVSRTNFVPVPSIYLLLKRREDQRDESVAKDSKT